MDIDPAFDNMSNVIHQDVLLVYDSVEDAIRACPRFLTPEEKRSAKAYLDHLLGGTYSDLQLVKLWNRTLGGCGGFCFSEDEGNPAASWFLAQLRASLLESMASLPDTPA